MNIHSFIKAVAKNIFFKGYLSNKAYFWKY